MKVIRVRVEDDLFSAIMRIPRGIRSGEIRKALRKYFCNELNLCSSNSPTDN